MRSRARSSLVAATLVAATSVAAPPVAAVTTCRLGGPTPSWSAVRLELPEGSNDLAVRLVAPPPPTPVGGDDGWHVAAGAVVVDATTGEMVASRVSNAGTAPPRAVVRIDGEDLVDQGTVGPHGPFEHTGGAMVPSLPAGTYYVVGFGVDGGPALPSHGWDVQISVGPDVACTPVGEGTTFELDHNDFDGGTQVSAYGAGMVEDVGATLTTDRRLVVGLMDAATQVTTPAEGSRLDYTFPDGRSGSVSEQIVPFAGPAGTYTFDGRATGVFPLLLVAGVVLDVPLEEAE